MAYLFEVAVGSIESALIAQSAGANRIELCAGLAIGGITPSYGMIAVARERLDIPMNVIIRPRRGDFLYSDVEFDMMQRDIAYAKSLGVNGVVIGMLKADGTVDVERVRVLVEQAKPLHVTFHRAFDMAVDLMQALDDLIALDIDTVLTSGQESSAEKGLSLITALVKHAQGRVSIMPGAGINPSNIKDIVMMSGASEFHFSGKGTVNSQMQYRNNRLAMGGGDSLSEYQLSVADADTIRAVIEQATL
jgi:copper homeostasis protein